MASGQRRAFPRWPFDREVRYGTGEELTTGRAVEISLEGMRIKGPAVAEDSEINIEFRLASDGELLKIRGRVKRSQGGELGIEFLRIRVADKLLLIETLGRGPSR